MYFFHINGADIEKRFAREFLNYVLGEDCDNQIDWRFCTRKRLAVLTKNAANRLESVNDKTVFWPNGKPFRCRRIVNEDFDRRRRPRRASLPYSHKHHYQNDRRCRYTNSGSSHRRDSLDRKASFRENVAERKEHRLLKTPTLTGELKSKSSPPPPLFVGRGENDKSVSNNDNKDDWYTSGFVDVRLCEEDEENFDEIDNLNTKIKYMSV
ncbi:lef6 protein [Gynaephora ruoergensis nucleopolyhedrovirus]|nr:lef6 protein [Gynaephora ruoergensis nucleopolyhedrovirus]